jgi:hypothetical protein
LGPDPKKLFDHWLFKGKYIKRNIGMKKRKGVKKQNKENIDADKLTSSKSRVDELPN